MAETIAWIVTACVIAGVAIWMIDKAVRYGVDKFAPNRQLVDAKAKAEAEKLQVEAEIARRTVDEATELRRAELRQKTAEKEMRAAEHRAAALLADDESLRASRLKAERKVITARATARAEAEGQLAVELVRAEHADNWNNALKEYDYFLQATERRGSGYINLDRFLELREQHA